jgi:hypothetical protein
MKKLIALAGLLALLSCSMAEPSISYQAAPTCTLPGCHMTAIHSHMMFE